MATRNKAVPAKTSKAEKAPPKAKSKSKVVISMSDIFADTLDAISKKQNVDVSSAEIVPPMSSGLLMYDLLTGGGLRPAWYSSSGMEQSAKTTTLFHVMGAAILELIPIIAFFDYEGSSKNSKPYILSILRGMGLNITAYQLFGKRDEKTGEWAVKPLVRYIPESILERFFNFLHATLRKLPDKKYINKEWWLRFDETKENSAKHGTGDAGMKKKYGKGIWLPAPDDRLQAIFFVDSFAAMNPESNDEEESNDSLALQARMFSKHLMRVKGRMGDKMVAVFGTNQLSAIPMAQFGPKEQEKGGNALRFYSDVRARNTSRASGYPLWAKNFNDAFEEIEKSVEFEGGTDRYRYMASKAVKNKLWTPNRQMWFRIWIEDGNGKARGFDPFFDTMNYLRLTGQLVGTGRNPSQTGKGGLTLNLAGLEPAKKALKWSEYKLLILGTKEQMVEICKRAGLKPLSLRKFCFKQVKSGEADKLFVANQKKEKHEEE